MALLPPVFTILKGDPAVTAILGNPPKAYSHGSAPQGTVPPYVTWTAVGSDPQNQLAGAAGSDRIAFQVDCYGVDGPGAENLATAVRDALEEVCQSSGIIIDEREPTTKFYRLALQFDYWLMR